MKSSRKRGPASTFPPTTPSVLQKISSCSFDINFLPRHEIYFGYVVRIIALGNNAGSPQNIDLIYNQQTSTFKVIIGESFSGISFAVDSPKLFKEWNRFAITCDLGAHTLRFSLNGAIHRLRLHPRDPATASNSSGGPTISEIQNEGYSTSCR